MGSKHKVADNVPFYFDRIISKDAFYFVRIMPKDADDVHKIQEAIRLFEENDLLIFQISPKIREKVIEGEELHSRLNDLKRCDLYRHNQRTAGKLYQLNQLHLALANFSIARKPHRGRAIMSCTTEEELDNKMLNYMMLHGSSRNLREEKQLLRNKNICHKTNDASSLPDFGTIKSLPKEYSTYNYRKQNICDKLLKEIELFEVSRKKSAQLKERIKNKVKIVSDELMEMWKQKQEIETKINHLYKQIKVKNEEIWSFQKHLKDKNCIKDASIFMLEGMNSNEYWVLKYCNLENESIYTNRIVLDKCTPEERRRRTKERYKKFISSYYSNGQMCVQ